MADWRVVGLGCGVIFHRMLAKKNPSPESSHNPASLPACFFDFAMQSNALFPKLVEELCDVSKIDVEWEQSSLLYVLLDDADLAFAKAVQKYGPGAGNRTQWLSPEELARAEPAVTRDVLGAMVFLGDDQINPYKLAEALIAGARFHGAQILSHAEVTGLRIDLGRVTAVETSDGLIPCKTVVNAAGAWAPQIGKMAGIELPVWPFAANSRHGIAPQNALGVAFHFGLLRAAKGHGEVIIGSTTEEVGLTRE